MDPESLVLQPPTSNPFERQSRERTPSVLRWVPVVSAFIGLFALSFQVFVLFPWHIQLSNEFAELQRSCLRT
jgi:hypothetical protein